MKAFKVESDTLKDLDHPNIVQYLGFEESEDFLSIFLEYVPGGTLSELLRRHGRFREEVTTSFLHQILQGLDYLHSRNIFHRDLKADNVLVEELGLCKISDWAITKKADDLYRGRRGYTLMKGTVYWMAPEVLSPDGQGHDAKVDIWSVGCVAVEMWTGSRPWSGFQAAPVMMKLFQEKLSPPIPADVSLSPLANDFRENCFHASLLKVYPDRPYSGSEMVGVSRKTSPRELKVANPDEGSDELRHNQVPRIPFFFDTPPPSPDPESLSSHHVYSTAYKAPHINVPNSVPDVPMFASDPTTQQSWSVRPLSIGRELTLAMRPKMEDVYENLESWLPDHDLDQPVADPDTDFTTTLTTNISASQPASHLLAQKQRNAEGKKSIRMIVGEQARRSQVDPLGSRRPTSLWNCNLKELKHGISLDV
ncbi:hypothetical protein EST38_g12812 [Candolleomyces aberdarensis]|uniref:Protein kinase domain-containing protein n=1 Tax=Candolleomyces aberdarensis TaxID=2316362 RepID=A0A4Q2D2M6_9AGAR|nr:hypothetical protein EST38_g12812 [Candolleomyces aberdarensis]